MTFQPTPAWGTPARGVPAQRGLGIAILVVTGLITAQAIVLGVTVATGNTYVHTGGAYFPFDANPRVGLLGLLAWLLVAQWMSTAARAAAADGYYVKHRPWVAWWGWIIPIWNLWAPFRYMKDATQGFPVRYLGWWWATWLLGGLTIWSSSTSTTIGGGMTQTQTSASAPFNAVALTVSWVLFARIVWTVSQGSQATSRERSAVGDAPTVADLGRRRRLRSSDRIALGERPHRLRARDCELPVEHEERHARGTQGRRLVDVRLNSVVIPSDASTRTHLVRVQPHLDSHGDQGVSIVHDRALGELAAHEAVLHLVAKPVFLREVQHAMGVARVGLHVLVEAVLKALGGAHVDEPLVHLGDTLRGSAELLGERLTVGRVLTARNRGVKLEAMPHHLHLLARRLNRGLEAMFSQVAPGASHIGPDINGDHRTSTRCGPHA